MGTPRSSALALMGSQSIMSAPWQSSHWRQMIASTPPSSMSLSTSEGVLGHDPITHPAALSSASVGAVRGAALTLSYTTGSQLRVHSHLPGGGASPPRGGLRSWMPAALDSSSRFFAPADSDSSALSSFSVADAAAIVSERAGRGAGGARDRRARRATGAAARVDAKHWLAMSWLSASGVVFSRSNIDSQTSHHRGALRQSRHNRRRRAPPWPTERRRRRRGRRTEAATRTSTILPARGPPPRAHQTRRSTDPRPLAPRGIVDTGTRRQRRGGARHRRTPPRGDSRRRWCGAWRRNGESDTTSCGGCSSGKPTSSSSPPGTSWCAPSEPTPTID